MSSNNESKIKEMNSEAKKKMLKAFSTLTLAVDTRQNEGRKVGPNDIKYDAERDLYYIEDTPEEREKFGKSKKQEPEKSDEIQEDNNAVRHNN